MMFTTDEARDLLERAGLFYTTRAEVEEMREWAEDPEQPFTQEDLEDETSQLQVLNMNDTWGWALAWGVPVPDQDLPELARLFFSYGYCGVLYWVAEREGIERSQFHDISRYLEFVRNEERIKAEVPDYNRRAFAHRTYMIGETNSEDS